MKRVLLFNVLYLIILYPALAQTNDNISPEIKFGQEQDDFVIEKYTVELEEPQIINKTDSTIVNISCYFSFPYSYYNFPTPDITDNSDPNPTVSYKDSINEQTKTVTRIFTATDSNYNTATYYYIITWNKVTSEKITSLRVDGRYFYPYSTDNSYTNKVCLSNNSILELDMWEKCDRNFQIDLFINDSLIAKTSSTSPFTINYRWKKNGLNLLRAEIQGSDYGSSEEVEYLIEVLDLKITPEKIPNATLNEYYGLAFHSPYSEDNQYVINGDLPSGLYFDSRYGVLSGTPTSEGIFNFNISTISTIGCEIKTKYNLKVGSVIDSIPPTISFKYDDEYEFYDERDTLQRGDTTIAQLNCTYNFPDDYYRFPEMVVFDNLDYNPTLNYYDTIENLAVTRVFVAKDSSGNERRRYYKIKYMWGDLGAGLSVEIKYKDDYLTYGDKYYCQYDAYNLTVEVFNSCSDVADVAWYLNDDSVATSNDRTIVLAFDSPGYQKIRVIAKGRVFGAYQEVDCNFFVGIKVNPETIPTGKINVSYSEQFFSTNQEGVITLYQFVGSLPKGMSYNQSKRSISGTPKEAGSFNFSISAENKDSCIGKRDYSLIIEKKSQKIKFDSIPDKSTKDVSFTLAATSDSGLPVVYSIVSGPATLVGKVVSLTGKSGLVKIKASQTGNDEFDPAEEVVRIFNVKDPAKKDQSISFESISDKTFGDSAFPITISTTSNLPLKIGYSSEPADIISINNQTIAIEGAGKAKISVDQEGNEEYNAAKTIEQSFTINKANQTIAFSSISDKNIDDDPFDLSATSSSNLPVTFEKISGPIILTGSKVTLTKDTGTVRIKALQEGNINYNLAPPVERSFRVSKPLALEPAWVRELKIFPNPATNTLNIFLPQPLLKSNLSLTNFSGQRLFSALTEDKDIKISLETFTKGIYIIRFEKDNYSIMRRLIIE